MNTDKHKYDFGFWILDFGFWISNLRFRILKKSLFICVNLWLIFFSFNVFAQTLAPGAPGKDAQWATAGKQGIGTANTLESKVWFTLQGGALTEVYYPDVTIANVHILQFVVVNPKTKKVETERDDAIHEIKVLRPDSLTFQQINTAKSGEWKITKTYATDVERNTILVDIKFEPKNLNNDYQLYVYYDPSLNNTGMHDTAWLEGGLIAQDGNIASALIANSYFGDDKLSSPTQGTVSNGFLGTSDALTELRSNKSGTYKEYLRAENGNVVQFAPISLRLGIDQNYFRETLYLGFGKNPQEALTNAQNSKIKGFTKCLAEYENGWSDYVKTLPKVESKYQAQFNMAAMVLRAQEDKTVRGANVASLTIPWGGANANEDIGGGYHLVWSRDLYQVVTAYLALGDVAAANRALDFLFKIQQKPDGSFPQNSWLDGRPSWNSLQLDEVAYPLVLAYQLKRFDKTTWENHVKKAADFLVKNGPRTVQERWEEEAGYSPSTIAAEIAGLVCAAEIARKNGDEASATIYLAAADDWARKVEMWTATTNGKYGDGNYYLRITQNGKPDAGERIELNNGAGFFDEREIVDAGFLELVRLGIKPADDKLIAKSVKVIDQILKVNTPNGESFYRYNHDGYGEMDDGRRWNWDGKYTGKGRLWALLAGERGQYELAFAEFQRNNPKYNSRVTRGELAFPLRAKAKSRLDAMLGFANEGLMIPEQIWDKAETPKNFDKQFVPELKFGEGTGSATPLAWSMAQFIRLAVNLQASRNLETPDVVYNRYVKNGIPSQASEFGGLDQDVVLSYKAGETVKVPRKAEPKTKIAYELNGEKRVVEADEKGEVVFEFKMPSEESIGIVGVETPDGATAFERIKILAKPRAQNFSPELIEKIKNAKQNPIIENGKAILFYRGAAKSVQFAGDVTSWNPGRIFLQPIADDLFAVQLDLPADARVEYKFVVDDKWIQDPFNSNNLDNGVDDRNSFFTMPEYKPGKYSWFWMPSAPIPPIAKRETLTIESKVFGKRDVVVYTPFAYNQSKNPAGRFPVLYLQDGEEYINRANAINIEFNLISAGEIKPFIIVAINPKDRMKEYWANDAWADFVANEVVPAVDAKYRTIQNRDGRALLGASLGGITSVHIGLKYPEKFARIGGQSSSFWIDDERVVKELEKLDPAKIKYTFYFDDGIFEGSEDTRRVNVGLRGKGFPVTYIERATGHNWTSWRDRLADAFVALWK